MAQIVTIIGITHNPFMPRLFKQPNRPPGCVKVIERIEMMREKLRQAKPDVLVAIGNDHLHQFFMDNMPAFMIGKMERYDGTFYDEEREFGLPKCQLPGDLETSDAIMEGAFDRGVDFAYSNELTIDHSIKRNTFVPQFAWIMAQGKALQARYFGPDETSALLAAQKVYRPRQTFLDYAGVARPD